MQTQRDQPHIASLHPPFLHWQAWLWVRHRWKMSVHRQGCPAGLQVALPHLEGLPPPGAQYHRLHDVLPLQLICNMLLEESCSPSGLVHQWSFHCMSRRMLASLRWYLLSSPTNLMWVIGWAWLGNRRTCWLKSQRRGRSWSTQCPRTHPTPLLSPGSV